jgi:hypothetical protein
MDEHAAQDERDEDQVNLPDPSHWLGFRAALHDVNWPNAGELLSGAGVTLAAGLGQIVRVDCGLRIG